MYTGGCTICRPAPIRVPHGGTVGFSLLSDLHLGAPQVDIPLIQSELDNAKTNGDRIAINGDLLDLILAKDLKRYEPGAVHPHLAGRNDLVNGAIEWADELLSPYIDQIDMLGIGNHETTVSRLSNTDAIKILIHRLESKRGNPNHLIHYGGYTGFLSYRLIPLTPDGEPYWARPGQERVHYLTIFYTHGAGGNSPVTRGMINFARLGWVQADVLWEGHRHTRWNAHSQTIRCPRTGNQPIVEEQRQIMTGAYFDTYRGQPQDHIRKHGRRSNYAADSAMQPHGKGGARLLVSLIPKLRRANDWDLSLRVLQ
jgi:hypothetical protein